MLLRKPTKLVKRKLMIQLPADIAARLDRLTEEASAAGMEASVEEAIASYLTRAIGHAEAELGKLRTRT